MGVCSYAELVITGAAYTGRARELMAEGNWERAQRYLMDSLVGMSEEQAIRVIEGDCQLVGQGAEVSMIAEDSEVSRALKQSYLSDHGLGGFVMRESRLYKAYKVVNNLGPEDTEPVISLHEVLSGAKVLPAWLHTPGSVDRKMCNSWVFPQRLVEARALFYANDPDYDFANVVLSREGKWVAVLFEEVTEGEHPPWREKQYTSTQSAYNELAEFLPVDGFTQTYGEPAELAEKPKPTLDFSTDRESARSQESQAEEHARYQARQAEIAAEVAQVRQAVVNFADNDAEYGWFMYEWKSTLPGVSSMRLRAPKRALHCYALSTTAAYHMAPAYKAFSPQGLKEYEDNPFHTDVWLGCGFGIDSNTYDRKNPCYLAVIEMMFAVQKELLKFEVQVLARGPELTGKVVYPNSPVITVADILVVPHAGVEFELQALKAGAVICEVGGRLAHLVTVCRETRKAVIRMDDACAKLPLGQQVTVFPDLGQVKIWS